ncbi:MAG: type II toxin-antitoxin system VapC family toxin [Chloroflexi bacterium]|nr:type II toxin-antitoxin system VapC family toxin [Chloroflexota bacterium]
MIVDTSALVAVLFGEPEGEAYEQAITDALPCRMSVANFLEAAMVVEGRGDAGSGDDLDRLVEEAPIELVPVTVDHVRRARQAWRRFGRGNHPAGLNFGDCFAYALADATREPLLFKGDDFALTDVDVA